MCATPQTQSEAKSACTSVVGVLVVAGAFYSLVYVHSYVLGLHSGNIRFKMTNAFSAALSAGNAGVFVRKALRVRKGVPLQVITCRFFPLGFSFFGTYAKLVFFFSRNSQQLICLLYTVGGVKLYIW